MGVSNGSLGKKKHPREERRNSTKKKNGAFSARKGHYVIQCEASGDVENDMIRHSGRKRRKISCFQQFNGEKNSG